MHRPVFQRDSAGRKEAWQKKRDRRLPGGEEPGGLPIQDAGRLKKAGSWEKVRGVEVLYGPEGGVDAQAGASSEPRSAVRDAGISRRKDLDKLQR